MKQVAVLLVPVFLSFAVLCLLWLVTALFRLKRRRYRSPLTTHLLRGPGYSLLKEIERMNEDIDGWLLMLFMFPTSFFLAYLASDRTSAWAFVLVGLGFVVFDLIKLISLMRKRFSFRLGLDCETAIGQELNHLMHHGYRVYHDFPADGFNIDHVVIGQNGVFAVETKGRPKPGRGKGGDDAKVMYDGQKLNFPGWVETKPLEQAKRQASWLSRWLTEEVGEKVVVYPALALPGWFIDRKKRDLVFLNGKDCTSLPRRNTGTTLSESLIHQISRRVEQRCRDVEPSAYEFKKANKLFKNAASD